MDEDNKKYYWIKLKEDFFQSYKMRALESIPNGLLYELIYIKLLAESTTHNGRLRFSKSLPYTSVILAGVLNVDKDNLESAIRVLEELELIKKMDDGTLLMLDMSNLVGCETEWANKKRKYRENHCIDCYEKANEDITRTKKDIVLTKEDIVRTKKDNVRQENRDKSIDNNNNNNNIECEEKSNKLIDVYDELQKYIPEANQIWLDYINYFKSKKLQDELIIYAIKETASKNIRSASYFKEICKNFINNDYQTVQQVEDSKVEYKKNKQKIKNNNKNKRILDEYDNCEEIVIGRKQYALDSS